MGYVRPVDPVGGRMSSWLAHTRRTTPSTEPGVDYYCPVGTPVRAAERGTVVDVGDSIMPATGRFVTIDLDDGRRVRYLHLLRRHVGVGNRVVRGQVIALSGATGYGEEDWSWNVAQTGGAHVHMTLWGFHGYRFGRYATLDPEQYMDRSAPAGGDPEPLEPGEEEEEMSFNPKIIHRNTGGDEWALVEPTLRGVASHERGYIVTTDRDEFRAWGRTWAKGGGMNSYSADVPRDEYIEIQQAAQRVHEAWCRTQAEIQRLANGS